MKLFKNFLLSLTILIGASFSSNAQSGWSTGQYYAYKGGTNVSCGNTYVVQKTDGWGNYWNEGWQNCQQRQWYQEYRSGYIYYWGNNGWYSQWKEGYFWYFTWYNYSVKVW